LLWRRLFRIRNAPFQPALLTDGGFHPMMHRPRIVNWTANMNPQSVESYIVSLLNTSFPGRSHGPITRNTDLVRDLDVDSMAMVSLIFSIDEEFGVGTDQLGDLVLNCHTVDDLISAAERLQRERV
jgi:acyl carrier protein